MIAVVKNMGRFHKWLDLESVIGHRPAQGVMEILAHLAYDTVREVSASNNTSQLHIHVHTCTCIYVHAHVYVCNVPKFVHACTNCTVVYETGDA